VKGRREEDGGGQSYTVAHEGPQRMITGEEPMTAEALTPDGIWETLGV